mmetsp:Transcript_39828/g.65223  ORF Transcript_39828/g.65223 Transcript_39828/m.65223 type:complete len:505 (+) Transcript_39828:2998-4512(+)
MSFFFNDLFGGGMPGGHHHHHHGHGDEDSDPEESDTEKFYKLLDIDKSATADDIKKAYRKKARTLHPDRHPDEREKYQSLFQEVQRANEVLKDPQKRALYDKYGEKGVKRGGGGSRSGSSLLEQMFGGGGRGGNESSAKKSPSIKAALEVTLEDIYCGTTKKLKIQRRVATDSSATCPRCKGQGQITEIQRMGPMVLQQRRECPQCGGIGYKLQNKTAEIEVHVPVGGKHGESVTIQGQGHQYPDMEPGDVVLQLRQQKHSLFERKGADLGMNYTLSLRQALCGFKIKIPHVCGKPLVVTPVDKHEIVQPGSLKVVHTQGLPQRYAAHVKGHLYIVMEVELPLSKTLPTAAIRQFEKLLPDVDVEANEDENDEGGDEDQDMDAAADNEEKKQAQQSTQKKKATKTKPKNKQFKNNRRSKSKKNLKKQKSKKSGGGVFGGLQGHFAASAEKDKMEEDEEDDDDEMVEHVECYSVDGNPKATPATASNYHHDDDDDEGDGVQCRQM